MSWKGEEGGRGGTIKAEECRRGDKPDIITERNEKSEFRFRTVRVHAPKTIPFPLTHALPSGSSPERKCHQGKPILASFQPENNHESPRNWSVCAEMDVDTERNSFFFFSSVKQMARGLKRPFLSGSVNVYECHRRCNGFRLQASGCMKLNPAMTRTERMGKRYRRVDSAERKP